MLTVPALDQFARLTHDSQCRQAQEVDLEQSDGFQNLHRVLSNGTPFLSFGGAVQWCIFNQWFVSDDDAGGVRAGVACYPFQALCSIDEFAYVVHAFINFVQLLRLRQPAANFYFGAAGDKLSDAIHFREGNVHGASHVPN